MILKVSVKPGSSQEKLVREADGSYTVWMRERADKGKANAALVRLLAREFKVAHARIVIKTPTRRKKLVELCT